MNRTGAVAAAIVTAALLLVVGGIALVTSYRHAWDVFAAHGDPVMAPWLPATTDGMIVGGLIVAWWLRLSGRLDGLGFWARLRAYLPVLLACGVGFTATLAANIASVAMIAEARGRQPGPWDYATGVWAPVAFVVVDVCVARVAPAIVETIRGARGPAIQPEPAAPVDTDGAPTAAADVELVSDDTGPRLPSDQWSTPVRTDTEPTDWPPGTSRWANTDHSVPDRHEPVVDQRNGHHAPVAVLQRTGLNRPPVEQVRITAAQLTADDWDAVDAYRSAGHGLPSGRQVRADHGCGKGRADRIVAALEHGWSRP